jgi:thioredoxin 1
MNKMIRSGWLLMLCLALGCTSHKLSDNGAPPVGDGTSPAASDSPASALEILADPETEDRAVAPESATEPEAQTLPEPVATGQPATVTDADFEEKVLRSSVPVLVDIWAEWCPPCRALAPIMDDIAAEYQGRAMVAKLDHDANPVTPAKYQVKGLPTMLFFKDGQLVSTLVGLKSKQEISRVLDSLSAS